MTDTNRVWWSSGLFLEPQHFQAQDNYHERRTLDFWRINKPWNWGVFKLDIDENILIGGRFVIRALGMVTPNGVLVRAGAEVGGANAVAPELHLSEKLPALGQRVGIHVGLVPLDPDGMNVRAEDEEGRTTRFVTRTAEMRDQFVPDANVVAEVGFVNYAVQLKVVDEKAESSESGLHDSFKLCVLRVDSVGLVIDENYLPPALRIDAMEALNEHAQSLWKLAEGRARELARSMQNQPRSLSPHNIWNKLVLSVVNGVAASLRTAAESGAMHPAEFHGLLRHAIAQLAAFSNDHDLYGELPEGDERLSGAGAYRHLKFGPQARSAAKVIEELLSLLAPGPEALVPLEYENKIGRFAAELPTHFFEGRSKQYYLLVRAPKTPADELLRRLNDDGKLADPHKIQDFISGNIRALPLELVTQPPAELLQEAQRYQIFRVALDKSQADGGIWQRVEGSKRIQLHSPKLDHADSAVMIAKVAVDE